MSKLPPNLISFGPDANCTLDICPLEASLLQYRPSVPVNSLFIAIFGFTTVAHLVQGFRTCSWGFMASIVCGNLLEIVGYVGRILLHDNPFLFSGFVMQIGISIQYKTLKAMSHVWTDTLNSSLYHCGTRVLLFCHLRSRVKRVSIAVVVHSRNTTGADHNQGQLCRPVNLTNRPACVLLDIHSFGYHILILASRRRRNFMRGQHRGRNTSRGEYLACRPDLPGHYADDLLRLVRGLCVPRLVVFRSIQDPATRQFPGVCVYCCVVDLATLCLPRC